MKTFLLAFLLALVVFVVIVESHNRGFKRGGSKRRRGPFGGWIKSMCKEGETLVRVFSSPQGNPSIFIVFSLFKTLIIFLQLLCLPNAAGNTPLPWFCFELELEVS